MISILIVSNTHTQISIRDFIGEILRKTPHPPVALDFAFSAEEAIEILSTESFTLLITDYELPELNGLELIRQVSDRITMKKALIINDLPSVEMRVKAAEAGADWVLRKPVSREILDNVIKSLV